MGIASLPLEIQLILVPTILFALTFHEYAHARVAYLLGAVSYTHLTLPTNREV